jgi:hypothetical protein
MLEGVNYIQVMMYSRVWHLVDWYKYYTLCRFIVRAMRLAIFSRLFNWLRKGLIERLLCVRLWICLLNNVEIIYSPCDKIRFVYSIRLIKYRLSLKMII